jgi:flagellar biosynthesis GTPase FlhF
LAAQLDELLARRCKNEQQLQQHLQPWREQWRAQWQKLNAISRADQQLQDQLVNRIAAEQQKLQAKAETKHASLQQLQLTLEQALELASDGKLLLVGQPAAPRLVENSARSQGQ